MKKNLLLLFFVLAYRVLFSQAHVVNSISGSSVLCSGIQTYAANISGSPTSYFWSVQSSSPTAIIVTNGYSVVSIAFSPIPMQYTITCTATNGSGSGQNSLVVQVYGTPTVTFSGARTICQGASSALSASSTMASSTMASSTLFYNWGPSTGLNNTNSANVVISNAVVGDYTYTLATISSLGNNCSSIDTITIHIVPCTGIVSYNKDENQMIVFPNPSSEKVFIKSSIDQKILIINELGQTIQTLNIIPNEDTRVVDLKPGIYFIVSATMRKKIIITRE